MSRENSFKFWYPQTLIRPMTQMDYAEFERRFAKMVFLLIKLQGHPATLLEDLAFACGSDSEHGDKPADNLGFRTHTVLAKNDNIGVADKYLNPNVTKRLPLPEDLYSQPCFLVSIKKRDDVDGLLKAITVGRTRNHDIVLRHNSVSKFHASFYLEDDGGLSIKDAGSKNKTWLNGRAITEQARVDAGAVLRFGSVETLVCDAAMLWNTIRNT